MNLPVPERGSIDAGGAIGTAFSTLRRNFGTMILNGLAFMLIYIAFSSIPYLGPFFALVVSYGFIAGFEKFALDSIDMEEPKWKVIYSGFYKFGQIITVGLILIGILIILMLPLLILLFAGFSSGIYPTLSNIGVLDVILIFLYFFFASLTYYMFFMFPFLLIMDFGLNGVNAFRIGAVGAIRNIGGIIVMIILQILISTTFLIVFGIIGAIFLSIFGTASLLQEGSYIALAVTLVYTCLVYSLFLPFGFSCIAAAYRDVFPKVESDYIYEMPPTPDYYAYALETSNTADDRIDDESVKLHNSNPTPQSKPEDQSE